jgi:PIN domain nuclease of toxin-antitoxin system
VIVADTHTWLWWTASPGLLSPAAVQALGNSDVIGVSAISCWEAATLIQRGRVSADRDPKAWIDMALQLRGIRLLPIAPAIGVIAALLPREFPGDPADRLITATAIHHGVPLVTKDGKIRHANVVETIW